MTEEQRVTTDRSPQGRSKVAEGNSSWRERPTASRRSRDAGQRYALIFVWLLVFATFSILRPETYFSTGNVQSMLGSQAVLLVLALGLIIPLTTGDFDLSVASVLTLCSMVLAILTVHHGWDLLPAIAVVLAIGVLVGLLNGLFVVWLGVDSFISTLGTGTFIQGIILWISDSSTISGVPDSLLRWVVEERLLGVSLSFWYGLALTIVIWYLLAYTALGRRLLFVGRNREVARLSGISVRRMRWGALAASSFVAAVAGILYAGTLGAADPTSGLQFLLPAFAATFLGATAIQPGRFNAWGTFVAVFFLVSGITGLQLLGAQSYVQPIFYGGALVVAVALSQVVNRRNSQAKAA